MSYRFSSFRVAASGCLNRLDGLDVDGPDTDGLDVDTPDVDATDGDASDVDGPAVDATDVIDGLDVLTSSSLPS